MMGILSFAQGCINVLVTLSEACKEVTYHLFDIGSDAFNIAGALFNILNKIGLLLLNIGKFIFLWMYQLTYIIFYTCWMVAVECALVLCWLFNNCLGYGTVVAEIVLSKMAVAWGYFCQLTETLLSWFPVCSSWAATNLHLLASGILSFVIQVFELLKTVCSVIFTCMLSGITGVWNNVFYVFFLTTWMSVCSIKDKCHEMVAKMCESLTAPFNMEALRLQLQQVTHDLASVLSSDWYRICFFCLLLSICACFVGRKLYSYLYRKGFTFPVYGLSQGNVIQLPADRHLDFIDLSDDEEPAFLQNLQVGNMQYYAEDDESDNDSVISLNNDIDSTEGSQISESTDSDNISNFSDVETDSEEFDLADDASDITELEYYENEPFEVQLPETPTRNEFSSRSQTPSRMTPYQLKRELENEKDRKKCVICTENQKDVLLLPCRHMCMCVDCAHHFVAQKPARRRICPLCRSPINSVMNIYL